jgi:hypothetical protein
LIPRPPSSSSSSPESALWLEGRGLAELEPQVEPDEPERAPDQERDPPAPAQQVGRGEQDGERNDQTGAHHEPRERPELEPARAETALLVGRVLGDEGHRAAVLPTGREALHEARDE